MKDSDESTQYWEKITVTAHSSLVDAVCAYLFDLDFPGVETREIGDNMHEIIGFFSMDEDKGRIKSAIYSYLRQLSLINPRTPQCVVTYDRIEQTDWSEKWKESFKPIKILNRLVVLPPWETYDPESEEHIIIIDPGMAFGTGQHETTRLCLESLVEIFSAKPSSWRNRDINILDAGCGTGVLSIAAILLGANHSLAVDNDPLAVHAATKNISLNRLQNSIDVRRSDTLDITGTYQLIAGNIQLNVLTNLAPRFVDLLDSDGILLVAGILDNQQEQLLNAYGGFRVRKRKELGNWLCLEMVRV